MAEPFLPALCEMCINDTHGKAATVGRGAWDTRCGPQRRWGASLAHRQVLGTRTWAEVKERPRLLVVVNRNLRPRPLDQTRLRCGSLRALTTKHSGRYMVTYSCNTHKIKQNLRYRTNQTNQTHVHDNRTCCPCHYITHTHSAAVRFPNIFLPHSGFDL